MKTFPEHKQGGEITENILHCSWRYLVRPEMRPVLDNGPERFRPDSFYFVPITSAECGQYPLF